MVPIQSVFHKEYEIEGYYKGGSKQNQIYLQQFFKITDNVKYDFIRKQQFT